MNLRASVRPPNALRYSGHGGHVESYFLRANDPKSPRAVWLKATLFAPLSRPPVVESWFIYFDMRRGAPVSCRASLPLSADDFRERDGFMGIRACELHLELGEAGRAFGAVHGERGGGSVALEFRAAACPTAAPLSLLRPRLLIDSPFPRSKLLTPSPHLIFRGSIDVAGETIAVDGWHGMQGHNWGREHAFEYAWGQCLFPASSSEPAAMLEGFSARVRVAGVLTPRVSALVVRRGERIFRFDRLLDLFRQEATVDRDRWQLTMRGGDGEARLEMDATGRPLACLGYKNPDGRMSYCMNSKLAKVTLSVQPRSLAAFSCESEFGGALEFLRNEPDARFPHVT